MSFILDALRKSESERRREATPGLAHIPPAAPRSHAPPWVWVVMGVLALGVLGVTVAWWQSTRTAPGADLKAAPAVAAESHPAASLGTTGSESRAPVATSAPTSASEPSRSTDTTSLPSAAEARASGLALPELNLQLISYSEDENERFVFINGFRYAQGQRVQNGPLVVSISPDSVVLRQQGQDFRLRAE